MLIIGEKLNSSIPKTLTAMREGDEEALRSLIRAQEAGGAAYLDVNTALLEEEELPALRRLAALIRRESACGLMLDSPNPAVLAAALPEAGDRPVMVNSVSLDARYDALLPRIREAGAAVVCLPLRDGAVPADAAGRVENAVRLADKLTAAGIPADALYIDVLAEAVATAENGAVTALDTIRGVKAALPEVKTVCGLSNISFGLPRRIHLNAAFLSMALAAGLDAAILDPSSQAMRTALLASEALLGRDEFCLSYIAGMRALMA